MYERGLAEGKQAELTDEELEQSAWFKAKALMIRDEAYKEGQGMKGGTGRVMYERGLAEGRAETNDEAYQQGVKDTKESYQKGYKDGATALLTELGKVEEKDEKLAREVDEWDLAIGWNDCLHTLREKAESFIKILEKGE